MNLNIIKPKNTDHVYWIKHLLENKDAVIYEK